MLRAKRVLGSVLWIALGLGVGAEVAAQTSTRNEPLRWNHSEPSSVAGYRVYYGTASRAYTAQIDVGIPSTDGSGAFLYDLQVPEADVVYVAVTAYDADALESDLSNERVRFPPPEPLGQPGQPIPVLE